MLRVAGSSLAILALIILTGCVVTEVRREVITDPSSPSILCDPATVCESLHIGQKISQVEFHTGEPVLRAVTGRFEVRHYRPCGVGYAEVVYEDGRVRRLRCQSD